MGARLMGLQPTWMGATGTQLQPNCPIYDNGPGGVGILTVTYTPSPAPDPFSSGNTVIELEWVELVKPLMGHPMFNPTTADSVHPNSGLYELNDTDRDHCQLAESARQ